MSQSRRCDIFKATDGQWYMELGNKEYAYEHHECSYYGPFASEEETMKELDKHSNPGAYGVDNSGKRPVPTEIEESPVVIHFNPRLWRFPRC